MLSGCPKGSGVMHGTPYHCKQTSHCFLSFFYCKTGLDLETGKGDALLAIGIQNVLHGITDLPGDRKNAPESEALHCAVCV